MKPRVVFFHIPKTAGTTIRVAVTRSVPDKALWYVKTITPVVLKNSNGMEYVDNLQSAKVEELGSRYQLIGGHFRYSQLPEGLRAEQLMYAAVFRDPISRALSYYRYLTEKTENPLHRFVQGKTLFEAVCSDGFSDLVRNAQLRWVFAGAGQQGIRSLMASRRFILGTTERVDKFLDELNQCLNLSISIRGAHNVGRNGYVEELEQQPRFESALAVLRVENKEEIAFYNQLNT